MSKPTIEDLLRSLQAPTGKNKNGKIEGSIADIYQRIANKDSFSELGLEGSELQDFLKEWIEENPYNNI